MIGTVGSTAEKWASYLRGNAAVETLGAEVSSYMVTDWRMDVQRNLLASGWCLAPEWSLPTVTWRFWMAKPSSSHMGQGMLRTRFPTIVLYLFGEALLCVLPGRARPVILHGYGGAKRDIPVIAPEGWVPFAHAMTGYRRPGAVKTSGSCRIRSLNESICFSSPCGGGSRCLVCPTTVPCARGWVRSSTSQALTAQIMVIRPILLTGKWNLSLYAQSLAMQVATSWVPHLHWLGAHTWTIACSTYGRLCPVVWTSWAAHWLTPWRNHGKPLMEVHTAQSFVDMENFLPPGRQNILLIDRQGNQLTDRAITSLRYENGQGVQLPVDMYIVHESAPDRNLPKVIRIDCTGLGGHDLGGLEPWHICLRSDRHGQNIYGPSLAILETTTSDPK